MEQTFLKALEECDAQFTDVHDLSCGFSYLLMATSATAENLQSLLAQVRGGGAA